MVRRTYKWILLLAIFELLIMSIFNKVLSQGYENSTVISKSGISEEKKENHQLNLQSSTFQNCYSRTSVSNADISGGLIGKVTGSAIIQNTFASGLINSGGEDVGGLIGSSESIVSVQSSYWDTDRTEQVQSAGGSPREREYMIFPYSSNTYAGWDFNTIWQSDNTAVNDGYPYLKNRVPKTYSLQLISDNQDRGSISGAGIFAQYTKVRVNAIPKEDNMFTYWSDESGNFVSDESDFIYSMTGNSSILKAHFERAKYQLSVNINPAEGGIVSGLGEFNSGTEIQLMAISNQGYSFINWTDGDGTVLSASNPYSFIMPSRNIIIIANFRDITSAQESYLHNIRIYPNPFNGYLHFENGNEITQVTIFTITGVPVLNLHSSSGIHSIDCNNIAPGIYLVQVFTKSGNKLIKAVKN
jgi:hypothetical protein